ncbi:sensor histidine kinase domain protein [Clostridioides difficile DA00165]|nr:sensor histidine kinase domain protein [Clostridioides difficile DA00165]
MGINLLIIVIMCSMWFFGIILALIYSVVLFKILSDYSKKTIYEYNQLLDVTKKISDGNLDVNMGFRKSYKRRIRKYSNWI